MQKISTLEKQLQMVRDKYSYLKQLQYIIVNDETNNTASPNELTKFKCKIQSSSQTIKDFYNNNTNRYYSGW